MERKIFVVKFLKPFLQALDKRIVDVFYQNTKLNGEYVYVYIKGGESIRLCITGDSPLSITDKVVRELLAQQAD